MSRRFPLSKVALELRTVRPVTEAIVRTRLEEVWGVMEDPRQRTMDWLSYEGDVRAVLAAAARNELPADLAVRLVDELLAAYTGRGSEFQP